MSRYPLGLVLMPVHFLRDWPGENWVFDFVFPGKPLVAIYHEYFQALKRGIRTGLFDAVAPLDLIRQPGRPVLATNAQDVEEVLSTAALAGMCLEINTSGLRRSQRLTYPAPELLPLAAAYRVPGITGSDAHEPHLVGHTFAEVRDRIAEVPGMRQPRFCGRRFAILPQAASRAIAS